MDSGPPPWFGRESDAVEEKPPAKGPVKGPAKGSGNKSRVRAGARCAFCGEMFEVRSARGRVPKYCRPSHRQRAYEERRLDLARESVAPRRTLPTAGGPLDPLGNPNDASEVCGLIREAARELLSERGLEGTTMRAVATRAGVAYGTVSYHFGSKEQLLFEVIRSEGRAARADAERSAQIADVVSRRRSLREDLRTRVTREPSVFKRRYELYALALRRDKYQRALASLLRASRASTADLLEKAGFTATDGERLAPVLQAAVDGLALQALVDPSFDHDSAHGALMLLLANYRQTRAAGLPDPRDWPRPAPRAEAPGPPVGRGER